MHDPRSSNADSQALFAEPSLSASFNFGQGREHFDQQDAIDRSLSPPPAVGTSDPTCNHTTSEFSGASTPGASDTPRNAYPTSASPQQERTLSLKPIAVTWTPTGAASALRSSSPPLLAPNSPRISDPGDRSPRPHLETFGSQKSWVRRVQARSEEVRRLFDLDPAEQLMNDYMCALKKKILLQGRLFVFEHHLCFYSSLFGYHKVKVVPIAAILDVKKRKNVGFPNSIEVSWLPETDAVADRQHVAVGKTAQDNARKREFFTSFVHREDAYRLILGLWAQCSEQGRERAAEESIAGPMSDDEEAMTSAPSTSRSGPLDTSIAALARAASPARQPFRWRSLNGRESAMDGETSAGDDAPTPTHPEGHVLVSAASSHPGVEGDLPRKHPSIRTPASSLGAMQPRPFAWEGPTDGEGPDSVSHRAVEGQAQGGSPKGDTAPASAHTRPEASHARAMNSMDSSSGGVGTARETEGGLVSDSSFELAGMSSDQRDRMVHNQLTMVQRSLGQTVPEFEDKPRADDPSHLDLEFSKALEPAPPLPTSMQKVLTCTLPTTPREFYTTFLSSTSTFFIVFHENQGHHSVKLSPWQRHFQVGPVRDLRFVTPLKGWRIGPPEALCHQTQRYRIYLGDHVVFETSQVMSDIPYSDYFRVDTRWDVIPGKEPGTVSVTVHIAVPFTKSTMWRKFIEKSVTDSSLEAYQMFTHLAGRELQQQSQSLQRPDGGLGSAHPADGNALPSAPVHSRDPSRASRASSPEENLPTSHDEWEALLAQVEPQWRGGLRALRRRCQNQSNHHDALGNNNLPRHHRTSSRAGRSAVLAGFDPNTAMASTPQQEKNSREMATSQHDAQADESQEREPPSSFENAHAVSTALHTLAFKVQNVLEGFAGFAPMGWSTSLLCMLCFVIISLQAVVLMRPWSSGLLSDALNASSSAPDAISRDANALLIRVERLIEDARSWQGQVETLAAAVMELSQRAHRLAAQHEETN